MSATQLTKSGNDAEVTHSTNLRIYKSQILFESDTFIWKHILLDIAKYCQDRFFTDLISTRGLGVRGWSSGKTEMLRSVVALPE